MTLADAPPDWVLDPGPDVREALREHPAMSYVCLAEVLDVTQSVVLVAVRSLQWDGLLTVRSGTRSDPVIRYTVNDPPATWDDADVWSSPDRPPTAPDEDDREPGPRGAVRGLRPVPCSPPRVAPRPPRPPRRHRRRRRWADDVKTTFTSPAALYVALRDAIADAGPTPCQLDDELDRRWFVEVVQKRGRAQAAAEAAQEVVDACPGCAVVDLCLRYALASHERDGVWGATTPEERAALLAAQPTTAA